MPSLIDVIKRSAIECSISGDENVEITGVTADSRQVKPGSVFVAIKGVKLNGEDFIPSAVEKGAAVIVQQQPAENKASAMISVNKPREFLARFAAGFYSKQPKHMVAITGTNGKTSTAEFYRQMWKEAGENAASIGTLGLRSTMNQLDAAYPAKNTSPGPELLFSTLAELSEHEVDYVALEASSHGLDQHRVDGAVFDAAAFTNLSRDHLDYHANMDVYFAAKARLFSDFEIRSGKVLLWAESDVVDRVKDVCAKHGLQALTYGRGGEYIALEDIHPVAEGLSVKGSFDGVSFEQTIPQYGAFQALNVCAAAGMAVAAGMEVNQAIDLMGKLEGVPGRLQLVGRHENGAPVFVDYAHTPDALQNVLVTLREHTHGRLHVVFGCGGDRDPGKRAQMGKIASEYADVVVVTDDNPRTEDAASIRREIMGAVPHALEFGDREEAIGVAVNALEKQDTLVVAGKGHETYQIIGEQTFHFDDTEKIKEALARYENAMEC